MNKYLINNLIIKQNLNKLPIIFLMGHTASGKTNISFMLKNIFPIEIINTDSTLFFRDMNIGTSKPSKEELINYPHKLIDIRDPIQRYSVFEFYKDVLYEIKLSFINKKVPLLVGGSIFYYKILLDGLSLYWDNFLSLNIKKMLFNEIKNNNYELFNKIKLKIPFNKKNHPNDINKLYKLIKIYIMHGNNKNINKLNSLKNLYNIYQIIIINDKNITKKKIKYRFYKMLELGFENEVFNLINRGDLNINMQSINSIGYKQMWLYLTNKISYINMIKDSILKTNLLMKHQITWIKNWKYNNVYFIKNSNTQKNDIFLYIKNIFKYNFIKNI